MKVRKRTFSVHCYFSSSGSQEVEDFVPTKKFVRMFSSQRYIKWIPVSVVVKGDMWVLVCPCMCVTGNGWIEKLTFCQSGVTSDNEGFSPVTAEFWTAELPFLTNYSAAHVGTWPKKNIPLSQVFGLLHINLLYRRWYRGADPFCFL